MLKPASVYATLHCVMCLLCKGLTTWLSMLYKLQNGLPYVILFTADSIENLSKSKALLALYARHVNNCRCNSFVLVNFNDLSEYFRNWNLQKHEECTEQACLQIINAKEERCVVSFHWLSKEVVSSLLANSLRFYMSYADAHGYQLMHYLTTVSTLPYLTLPT